jgi:uncharacterized protein (TIGR00369 family)
MSDLIAHLTELKARGDYAAMTEAIPYAKWMGITFEPRDGELLGKMAYSDMLVGNPTLPALHGGALGALLEMTGAFSLMWGQETIVVPKTINVTLDYLRSARPVDTWASATVTKLGRRVASVRATAWQEDRVRPVSAANMHFLIIPQDRDAG